jgi:ADP-ribose pyrophosphatase
MTSPETPNVPAWSVTRRSLVFEARPWLSVYEEAVRLPDGRLIEPFLSIEQPSFVVVGALTQSDKFIVRWNYKHGPRRVTLEFPGGALHPLEPPIDGARRELTEETGFVSERWTELGSFVVNGNHGAGSAHFFLARDVRYVQPPRSGDLEDAVCVEMGLADLRRNLRGGSVAVLAQAAGMLLALEAAEAASER